MSFSLVRRSDYEWYLVFRENEKLEQLEKQAATFKDYLEKALHMQGLHLYRKSLQNGRADK